MTDQTTRMEPDPADIERDVRRTQDQIGETVQKLEDRMNPRDIARSAIGDDGTDVAREALEVTRQNPIPVAMIAVGAIWLLATSQSPMIRRLTDRLSGKRQGASEPRAASSTAQAGPPREIGTAFDRRPIG